MASPNTGVITQVLGAVGYSTTGKHVDSYPPTSAGYSKNELWTSPTSGNKFTYATFLQIPDQEDLHGYRNLLVGANTALFFAARNWYNYTDQGSNTNRFYVQAFGSGFSGWGGFTKAEDVHDLNPGDWFAFMFSIDYSASGVSPTVEVWVQKKGESTAIDITPTGGDVFYNDNGPQTFDFDNSTSETVLLKGHSDPSYDDYYIAADVSEVYATNEFVDWSDSAERAKYVDSAGEPVGLGSDGSALTGTAAKIYFPDGDATNNGGTGGNFTQSGTIPDSTTSPSSGGGGSGSNNISQAATAKVHKIGAIGQTLSATTQSMSGIVWTIGSISQLLPSISQIAYDTFFASAAQTLPAPIQAGTATSAPGTSSGVITQTSSLVVTQALTAEFFAGTAKGPIAQTLWPITQSLAGTYEPGISSGVITQTMNGIVSALNGTHQRGHYAEGDQTVPFLVSTLTATNTPSDRTGSISHALPIIITQSATATYDKGASTGWITNQALPFINQVLTGEVWEVGSISQTLPVITQAGTATFAPDTSTGSISQIIPFVNQALTGSRLRTGIITNSMAFLTQSLDGTFMSGTSTGSMDLVLPSVAQSATAQFSPGTSTGVIASILPFINQTARAVTYKISRPTIRLVWEQPVEELIWESQEEELIWRTQFDTAPRAGSVIFTYEGDA